MQNFQLYFPVMKVLFQAVGTTKSGWMQRTVIIGKINHILLTGNSNKRNVTKIDDKLQNQYNHIDCLIENQRQRQIIERQELRK